MTPSISGLAQAADRGHPSLLTDKLEVPAIGLAVIGRPRVAALMDEATGHRVTVVTGPAGAGKTVACASWAAARAAARGEASGRGVAVGPGSAVAGGIAWL